MQNYQWGIIGTGDIAHQFAKNFKSTESSITGVAARDFEKTKAFAKEYSVSSAYETVEEMLDNPDINMVYIAVPNNIHHYYITKALQKEKHVLCEKAMTMTSAELQEETDLANENNLVLQEAMTIFNMPLYQKLKEIADSGELGKLKMIQAPFGSYKEPDPNNRFFNPDLAGGALLDIGTYAVSFARFFLSSAPSVSYSEMIPFETGVDEESMTILKNDHNEMASVNLSFQAKMPKKGIIAYEKGYITIDEYPRAEQAEITYRTGETQTVEAGNAKDALNYEVQNMIDTIKGNENTTLPLTTDVIQVLDEMRSFWEAQ